MTRSSKAVDPKAIARDRAISRNGRDASLKKGGHLGWGNLSGHHLEQHPDEWDFEPLDDDHAPEPAAIQKPLGPLGEDEKAAKIINEKERSEALDVRKQCLKDATIDLASIARTSLAASHSPSSSPETHSVLSSSLNSRASVSSGSMSGSYK